MWILSIAYEISSFFLNENSKRSINFVLSALIFDNFRAEMARCVDRQGAITISMGYFTQHVIIFCCCCCVCVSAVCLATKCYRRIHPIKMCIWIFMYWIKERKKRAQKWNKTQRIANASASENMCLGSRLIFNGLKIHNAQRFAVGWSTDRSIPIKSPQKNMLAQNVWCVRVRVLKTDVVNCGKCRFIYTFHLVCAR